MWKTTREKLAEKIKQNAVKVIVEKISPKEMMDNNLNDLEMKAVAKIMAKASQFDIAIIDSFEHSREAFLNRLKKFYPVFNENQIIAEHNADKNYTVTGAASIIAKTESEKEIKAIEEETGMSTGGGAPCDRKTVAWVKAHPHHPMTRKKWITYKRIMEEGYSGGKIKGE